MKQTKKKILGFALSVSMIASCFGMSASASAEPPSDEPVAESTYTLSIPSELTVSNSSWNRIGIISATGSLADGKKLTVTASSGDEFALVNQSDNTQKIGYMLATASTDTEATTSWEFTELSDTATKKDIGIIVDDYSTKPAGTYTDTVTFTAKVEGAAPVTIKTVTWDDMSSIGIIYDGQSKSKDGVTVKAINGMIDGTHNYFSGVDGGNSFQFSVASGNITKIEITTSEGSVNNGNGWSSNVWTGKANTVNFGEYFYATKIVFTIEDEAPATILSGALVDGATIKVNFKWRMRDSGDYVQGVYNASSGTFTVSTGGSDWGRSRNALYKVEKNDDNIIIRVGMYNWGQEDLVWTFNTTNDTYTQEIITRTDPSYYGLTSVTLNGTNITSQLTKN